MIVTFFAELAALSDDTVLNFGLNDAKCINILN
jgi:hypothetical protein